MRQLSSMSASRKRKAMDPIGDDQMDSATINAIVAEIVAHSGTAKDKEARFERKYPAFVERYPFLFALACAPDFDAHRFNYMMSLREQVQSRDRTAEDASKEVGQVLFDEYVKPMVGKMTKK